MSDPKKLGPYIMMVLQVSIIRPFPADVLQFWGKPDNSVYQDYTPMLQKFTSILARVSFTTLRIKFDQNAPTWSFQAYRAFVDSVKANYPGNTWEYLGYALVLIER